MKTVDLNCDLGEGFGAWAMGNDAATGQLMVRFYQGLKEGRRKDEALRDAMLAVKQPKPAPYYWAAFQVIGDTSPCQVCLPPPGDIPFCTTYTNLSQ